MHRKRFLAILIGFLICALAQTSLSADSFPLFSERPEEAGTAVENSDWKEMLAEEGPWLLIVRHGKTAGDPSRDMSEEQLEARRGERVLSTEGWREAERAGEFLDTGEISPTGIYASPLYRARDTAKLVFGDYEIWEPLRSADAGLGNRENISERLQQIRQEGNREVWVTHSPNVADILGFWAGEGQMFLLRWEGDELLLAGTWRIDLAAEE